MRTLMEETSQSTAEEILRRDSSGANVAGADPEQRPPLFAIPAGSKLLPVAYSFADQAFAVGGGFLVNVALARTQTKEEYGMFALSYSVFTFLAGLHNAAVLEPYTVYGSGRYRERFPEYLRLMARSNILLGLLLTATLLLICLGLFWGAPQLLSRALLGLSMTVGVLLSGTFLRRAFYVQRQPARAAESSLVFFIVVACGLWLVVRAHWIDSLTVFLVLAAGWITAILVFGGKLQLGKSGQHFLELEPTYWREHWKYSRWVLATALVFQLTTQGYYWLLAGFLSAKEVGELRAMYLLIGPVDQAFIALSYLVVPALAAHYAAKRIGSFLSLWKRFTLAIVGITALFALAVRVAGKPTMHILYAGRYDGLAPFLFILGLLPLVMWIGTAMGQALNAIERPKFVFWAYLSSGCATFLGGIPLVMHFGLWGAVYGMLLSGVTYTVALAAGFLVQFYAGAFRRGVSV
jgi:O-antigen/teichoic acid export membrane protein